MSVAVAEMLYWPASSKPGEQDSVPLPLPLSLSAQKVGRPLDVRLRPSPSGSVADSAIVKLLPSATV